MPPNTTNNNLPALQNLIWAGRLPLEIRLSPADCRSYTDSSPYLIQFPRLSYLAFLLPRLHAFFAPKLIDPLGTPASEAWFEFEGVPLKWHCPCGLLFDIHSGAEPVDLGRRGRGDGEGEVDADADADARAPLPWKLTLHYSDFPTEQLYQLDLEGRAMHDSFVNAVKEADFVRNGSARTVMGLSKEDSDNLWRSVREHDMHLFNTINTKLLNPPGVTIRHIPLKIYLPTSASHRTSSTSQTIPETAGEGEEDDTAAPTTGRIKTGHIRVVQSLVPLTTSTKQPQTLGTALNGILPDIFPSRRSPLLALPVLHGAVVPLGAGLGDLSRAAGFGDGFLHVAVVMMS